MNEIRNILARLVTQAAGAALNEGIEVKTDEALAQIREQIIALLPESKLGYVDDELAAFDEGWNDCLDEITKRLEQ